MFCFKYKTKPIILSIFLTASLLITSFGFTATAHSADLLTSYQILRDSYYDEFVQPLIDAGATEAQIESFLTDLDAAVNQRGPLNDTNFNSIMYDALQDVITWHKHYDIFMAMTTSFEEEISYTLANNQLHERLIPLRNAVKQAVLGNGQPGGPGGGGGTLTPEPTGIAAQIQNQLKQSGSQISLQIQDNGKLNLASELMKQIRESRRNLKLTWNGVEFAIPASVLSSWQGSLVASVAPLDEAESQKILEKTSPYLTLVGSILELKLSSDASIGSMYFFDPITITFSYAEKDLGDIKENTLDVYYYNETTEKWQKMNGTLSLTNNTISISTTHCSKYAIMSLNTPAADPQPVNFTDLANHWAQADIMAMVGYGLVNGIGENQFAPDQNITRAEYTAILLRTLGIPEDGTHMMGKFSDVPASSWFFNTVNTAAELGLVSGYDSSTFGPNDQVTREQMAVMIKRAFDYTGRQSNLSADQISTRLAPFADREQIAAWAREAAAAAIEARIINGRTPTEFAPRANATRAEAAVMLLRMYNQLNQ
ncbi:MAG: S-layer homology domain-containing protein [Syntrophomonadaceae bacterium]